MVAWCIVLNRFYCIYKQFSSFQRQASQNGGGNGLLEFIAVELQMVDDESAEEIGEFVESESIAVACSVEVDIESLKCVSNKF